jgi:hypothetical protein
MEVSIRFTIHKVSSHACIPSFKLGLALCIIIEQYILNLIIHAGTVGLM